MKNAHDLYAVIRKAIEDQVVAVHTAAYACCRITFHKLEALGICGELNATPVQLVDELQRMGSVSRSGDPFCYLYKIGSRLRGKRDPHSSGGISRISGQQFLEDLLGRDFLAGIELSDAHRNGDVEGG